MTVLAVRYGDFWACVWNVSAHVMFDELDRRVITAALVERSTKMWQQITLEELPEQHKYKQEIVSDSSQPFLTFRPSADLPFPT